MNFAAWAPPPLPTYQFTAEEQAAIDAAPTSIYGPHGNLQHGLWAAQQVCIYWSLPSRFVGGVSPHDRFRTRINDCFVATVNLNGLVYLHDQMLKRQRRR